MFSDWLEDDERHQRERQRQRQRQQDRHRVQPRLELRRQDQIHEDERQRDRREERRGGAIELARAAGEVGAILRRRSSSSPRPPAICLLRRALRRARQHVGDDRDLPLTADAADRRRRIAARRSVAMLSSVTMPSRDDGTGSAAIASCDAAVASSGAQVHFVLLAGLVVGRHLIAADQQPQRFGRIGDSHAEVGGLRADRACTDNSGLPALSEVSTSTRPGIARAFSCSASLYFSQLARAAAPAS